MGKRKIKSNGGVNEPQIACYLAAHDYPGGLQMIANQLGVLPDTLRKKLDPAQSTHLLGLHDAMHILRLTRDERILDAVAYQVSANWFWPDSVDAPADMDVLTASNSVMRSAVDLITELEKALEDGTVDADERARFDKQLMNLSRQMQALDNTAARFESGRGNV